MDYRWIGAFHLIAGVVWVSGMLLLAIVASIYAGKGADKAGDQSFLNAIRSWNRNVTSPAMLLLWVFGIILIIKNGDVFQPWLIIKLLILVFLSAVHGTLSKTIRKLATHESITPGFITKNGKALIIFAVAVIILVTKFRASLL